MALLHINPKSQTVIRVLMDYEGLNSYRAVEPLKIVTPKRRGFTVVKWGGMLRVK